ncbi:MAG: tRNA (adenosine(37)-N6)-threonylcarbamoyltransferase complex ATPase subunit type 1 TsaE [Candidatus Pacebacteria bacterium CG_4_10_14_3_um_filter_34_15]|nr:tRNA (adenosine(37)-N6)-threonylcarbamoyltransferase complex ATPase subunit type 1 TsaE [Candidatus Paceibacterota bacterium]OIO45191.1 MAG: tRNA (adenosine(37)-N6)-threonylcarbamoyltransferase complex ATPase subunit type 1 TsaE [Candidatus Pacebacteria bacterium CG1_02_43_31]PIQ81170.1 MAG: tRNA (adenosine(37)-N6)-threonylcarbamoyltransferase complex ATPase subunit type 1 TsaE [Candidatus Pacebacteria bacterium CG11_big_fil_rev_8_21_14_0_20_34_55]PIX81271.1 MAG: tRNA (adenosine(37)-N6)-threo
MKIINVKNTSADEVIAKTIKVLNLGGLIVFPTETTYGAGVDATNNEAVKKLLAYKIRREGKPLSIAVSDKKMAAEYVFINDQADSLFKQFLPGPVTVVCKVLHKEDDNSAKNLVLSPKSLTPTDQSLAPGVASEFQTLGIRIPNYQLILNLIEKYQKPITATSANASGKKRPYSIDDIFKNASAKQKDLIDLVLDAGELPHNDPSTVIDTTLSTPVTLRGGLNKNNPVFEANQKTQLISNSEEETQEIAGRLLLKDWNEIIKNGLIVALNGNLGTGKTIFTKGVAKFLNIQETIKSPTYSYIEEYDFTRHQTTGKLFHLDMWKVEDKNMFDRLEIESLIGKNNIIVIEWFDQISKFIDSKFKNTKIVKILISQYKNKRTLEIS